jgi:hypothetical protein
MNLQFRWIFSGQERGTHPTLFRAACEALEDGWNQQETMALLNAIAECSDRPVPDREKYAAIQDAKRDINGETPRMAWPRPDLGFRVEVLRLYAVERAILRQQSPDISATQALARLYRPQDLVCVGRTATDFETRPLDTLREPETLEFINPSPMSALFGATQGGRFSAHAKSNTGPRVYAVVEFDFGEWYEHAILHRFLATRLPLVTTVYSGATSLHGWFNCAHASEEQVKNFYSIAASLGADTKMFSACQFTRLPGGRHRGTGRKQTIMLNPQYAYHQQGRPPTQDQQNM